MTIKIIEANTYPHYEKLPVSLKNALNMLRTHMYEGVEGSCEVSCVIDHNDIEFLNLESLLDLINKELPDFDTYFLKAASRIHKECYEEGLFDYFVVNEDDLYETLLHVKDAYELKLAEDK